MPNPIKTYIIAGLLASLLLIGIQPSLTHAIMYRDKSGRLHISDSLPMEGEYTIVKPSKGSFTPTPSEHSNDWEWSPVNLPSRAESDLEPKPPSAIFANANRSVWTVMAALSGGALAYRHNVLQGSAVAISPKQLLTNCHVVKGMPYIVVKHGDVTARAEVKSGDLASDRCVLQVQSTTLTPVDGYRVFSSLEVGEEVYTIGSPRGLENTLGKGIVSGIRKAKGQRFVQTTAQVSPGSSGGGLFDRAGNLVGVTTFILLDSDGLNFAIAAEDFQR